MELKELQLLIQDPTKLANKMESLAPNIEPVKWEIEDHPVMDPNIRKLRAIEVPTGVLNDKGEPMTRVEYEEVNRIPSPTNKDIVAWAVRMSLGVPVQLDATPKDANQETLINMMKKTLSANKMEFWDQEIERQRLIYQYVLEVWYSEPANDGYWDGIADGVKFKWKIMIMSAEYGDKIVPVYNSYRELLSVARFFKVHNDEGKEIQKMELYTEDGRYTYIQDGGTWALDENVDVNGFKANHKDIGKKLMCVLWEAKRRETKDVEPKLDRREVIDSDTADENAASGRPILAVWGQIQAVAKRGDTGKTFQLTGGTPGDKPDMKYIERKGAADAVDRERKNMLTDAYVDSNTPDPAMFNELASGNAPGINIKLRFTPAINKALSRQQGELGMGHQRRHNVLKSGLIASNLKIKSAQSMEVKPKFGISIPENETERNDNIIKLVGAGLMSREKAVEKLALTDDNEAELARIMADLDSAVARSAAARPANTPITTE